MPADSGKGLQPLRGGQVTLPARSGRQGSVQTRVPPRSLKQRRLPQAIPARRSILAPARVPSVASTMPVDKIIAALREPPKQSIGKIYTLEEITKSFEVQKLMRAVEVNSVAFDFDSADVKDMQAQYLANIGAAIKKILKDSPEEVFFIGGHADAPGTEAYNQKLSNKRALQVKNALVNIFGIPAKNIMAGGFGEKHLKVPTDRPEQANRRVTVRCITPLVKTAETTN